MKKEEHSPYIHKTKYYETDQMQLIHHSNYIRWFEEARCDLMEQLGMGYDKMEAAGIFSPVLSVQCSYKAMMRFGDQARIRPRVLAYNGAKLVVGYEVCNAASGLLCAQGETSHCFMDREGRLLSLKRANPDFHAMFLRALEQNRAERKPGERKPGERKPGERKPAERESAETKNEGK